MWGHLPLGFALAVSLLSRLSSCLPTDSSAEALEAGTLKKANLAATAAPTPHWPWNEPPYNSSIRPLVIWHGMGDSAYSAGMIEFAELLREVHPGMFIHLIHIEDTVDKDQKAGFFGNIWDQLDVVNAQLNNITELKFGFDAIGFSQGGQFLRAYVEKYNYPPVNNLVTFGSQHMGVSDLPTCRPGDVFCQLMRIAARRGVYSAYAQKNLIQAQYFRDPNRLSAYYETNDFLTRVNGEVREKRDKGFKKNLASLNELVLIMFSRDTTVVPRESSWFGSFAPPADDEHWGEPGEPMPMRMQPLYKHDWIGLKALDQAGRVTLLSCDGEHMQITRECWEPLVDKYTGGPINVAQIPTESLPHGNPVLHIQS